MAQSPWVPVKRADLGSQHTTSAPHPYTKALVITLAVVAGVTLLNTIWLVSTRGSKSTPPMPHSVQDQSDLRAQVSAQAQRLNEIDAKLDKALAKKDDLVIRSPAAPIGLQSPPPDQKPIVTPVLDARSQFLARLRAKHRVADYEKEMKIGGDGITTNSLFVRVKSIKRTGKRFELFVEVKNVSVGDLFAPQAIPHNEQMMYPANCEFIDSFSNYRATRLEKGTSKLKPGESAIVQYSVTVEDDAPLYFWKFHVTTGNWVYGASYYVLFSGDDVPKQ